jgi:Putative zinc-finger
MDHDRIDEEGLVERYVAGRLGAAVRDAFEAHLVDCAPCLERIEEAERLRAALAAAAPVEAARPVLAPAPVLALLRRRASPRLGSWALAAGLAAACGAVVVLQRQGRQTLDQLEATRAAATEADRRAATQARALSEAQASLAKLEDRVALLTAPRLAPVFALALTRGAGAGRVLGIPRESQWVVLSLEAGGDPEYGAVLRTAAGQVLFEARRLVPSSDGLAVTFLSDLVPPGDYVLAVTSSASAASGRGVEVRFPFRTRWAR